MTDLPLLFDESEPLMLLPERAVLRPSDDTLFVADVHLGKAAAFRASGIAVPPGTSAATLQRLGAVLDRTGANRLVILGDLLHARAGRQPRNEAAIATWRAARPDLRIVLVRGNHDRMAGDPAPELDILVHDAPVVDGSFTLLHHPRATHTSPWLAGHLHPGVELYGSARQRQLLPCFYRTGGGLILPAFGDFTGLAPIRPKAADGVYVIAGTEVIGVSRPRDRV